MNSPAGSWTEYLDEEATQVIEDNTWVGLILLWLTYSFPFITRCQVTEFLRDVLFRDHDDWQKPSDVSQRVRRCLNRLSSLGVLAPPLKTYFRPRELSSDLWDSSKNGISCVLTAAWYRNICERQEQARAAALQQDPQTFYYLNTNSPASTCIRELTANTESLELMSSWASKQGDYYQRSISTKRKNRFPGRSDPDHYSRWSNPVNRELSSYEYAEPGNSAVLMNLPHWIGNAELFFMSIAANAQGKPPVVPGFLATRVLKNSPARLMAFRHDSLWSLEPIGSVQELDARCEQHRKELICVARNPTQSIAFSYLPKDWFGDGYMNTRYVATAIEKVSWMQARLF